MLRVALFALFALLLLAACRDPQSAAQQDPMACERNPKCQKKRLENSDCSTQCSDDPACMQRCEEVQRANGPLGH